MRDIDTYHYNSPSAYFKTVSAIEQEGRGTDILSKTCREFGLVVNRINFFNG